MASSSPSLPLALVLVDLALHDLFAVALAPDIEIILTLEAINHGDYAPVLLNVLGVLAPLGLGDLSDERCELKYELASEFRSIEVNQVILNQVHVP